MGWKNWIFFIATRPKLSRSLLFYVDIIFFPLQITASFLRYFPNLRTQISHDFHFNVQFPPIGPYHTTSPPLPGGLSAAMHILIVVWHHA